MELTTTATGDLTAARVTVALLARGYEVLKPITDRLPYDLAISWFRRNIRLQVRTAYSRRNGFCVSLQKYKKVRFSVDDCDFILAHIPERDLTYVLPIEELGHCEIILRPDNPKSKWAKYKEAWHYVDALLCEPKTALAAYTTTYPSGRRRSSKRPSELENTP